MPAVLGYAPDIPGSITQYRGKKVPFSFLHIICIGTKKKIFAPILCNTPRNVWCMSETRYRTGGGN